MIKEHCGVFGIYGHKKAAETTYLGLFALQHRGEESAGIVASDGEKLRMHKGLGLVDDVFDEVTLKKLKGDAAIGHVRYSTSGATHLQNASPQLMRYSKGQIAVAHNGNLTNAGTLKDRLEHHGAIFQSTVDSEIIIHLLAKPSYKTKLDGLIGAVKKLRGAYSLTVLTEEHLVGVRDPHGWRPLSLGKLNGGWVLSSETCAFDLIGAEFVRDIEPGELIVIGEKGIESHFPFEKKKIKPSQCIFEFIYFSRPDSQVFGRNVSGVRKRLGQELAKKHPVEADMVISVPDSGNFAALGYSKESGIPYEMGFTRNHYIGRTFINPAEQKRAFNVKIKLNPIQEVIEGKRVVVVDDSIVRGNTARSRVEVLRAAGAKEVHLRISCPPHKYPCYFGIDFPDPQELIANRMDMEAIKKHLNVDSLGYLDTKDIRRAAGDEKADYYCMACFDGKYPEKVDVGLNKYSLGKD